MQSMTALMKTTQQCISQIAQKPSARGHEDDDADFHSVMVVYNILRTLPESTEKQMFRLQLHQDAMRFKCAAEKSSEQQQQHGVPVASASSSSYWHGQQTVSQVSPGQCSGLSSQLYQGQGLFATGQPAGQWSGLSGQQAGQWTGVSGQVGGQWTGLSGQQGQWSGLGGQQVQWSGVTGQVQGHYSGQLGQQSVGHEQGAGLTGTGLISGTGQQLQGQGSTQQGE
jgi:hypothetical protein